MIDQSLSEALAHLPRVVIFIELARQGSFRETARALGLAPSTVSHHIKTLEDALGVRLIERTTRSMTLTAAGRSLLAEAEGLVGLWKRGASRARGHADEPVGNLVVTAPDVVAERFVVPAIGALVARHDRIEVELRISTKNEDLLAEGIDVAVRIGPLQDSSYGTRVLHRGHHGLVAAPPVARAWPAKKPGDLDGAPWVWFGRDPARLALAGPGGETHPIQGKSRARATGAGAFIGLILAGAGFGAVPRVLIQQELREGRLELVLPEWSRGPASFYAVTPSPRAGDVKVQLFTDLVAQAFQEAGELP